MKNTITLSEKNAHLVVYRLNQWVKNNPFFVTTLHYPSGKRNNRIMPKPTNWHTRAIEKSNDTAYRLSDMKKDFHVREFRIKAICSHFISNGQGSPSIDFGTKITISTTRISFVCKNPGIKSLSAIQVWKPIGEAKANMIYERSKEEHDDMEFWAMQDMNREEKKQEEKFFGHEAGLHDEVFE